MSNLTPKECIQTKRLMEKGRFYEALQSIERLEKEESLKSQDQLSLLLFKCTCLNRLLLGEEDTLKYAEIAFQESQKLGKPLQSIDALIEIAETLIWLTKHDKAIDIIDKSEKLLKEIVREAPKELAIREASLVYVKGRIYVNKYDYEEGLKHFEQSLLIREELDDKQELARTLFSIGQIHFRRGNLDVAREYCQRGLAVAEEGRSKHYISLGVYQLARVYYFKGEIKRALDYGERSLILAEEINYRILYMLCLNVIANCYSTKGHFDRVIELHKQKIKAAQEINNKRETILSLNLIGYNYQDKGDLEKALTYMEESLALYDENVERGVDEIGGDILVISLLLGNLFELFIAKRDFEQARIYFQRLDSLPIITKRDELYNRLYRALLLKGSQRAYDRGKAEEILKQVVSDGIISIDITYMALINLCDLLLIELYNTNDPSFLDKIRSYIAQMLDLAEKNRSYFLLGESYLLQAKLSLLTLEIKQARRLLTQAQQIAERWGHTKLVKKISNEQDNLREHLSEWERLKESSASLHERMKLARVDDQMKGIIRDGTMLTTRIIEEKISVHKERKICLVCRGDVGGFMFMCPNCDTIYCKNCAQALTDLENVCWNCSAPIDPSKPIRSYEKEEDLKISSEKDKKSLKK